MARGGIVYNVFDFSLKENLPGSWTKYDNMLAS